MYSLASGAQCFGTSCSQETLLSPPFLEETQSVHKFTGYSGLSEAVLRERRFLFMWNRNLACQQTNQQEQKYQKDVGTCAVSAAATT